MTITIHADHTVTAERVPATEKQIAFLRQLGYTGDTDELDIEEASQLIEGYKRKIEEAKQRILQTADVAELVGNYAELRRETPNELAGPCPKCGGQDRFHCTADWFFCRKCHPKRGDAIEFIMWKDGRDFMTAVAILTTAQLSTGSAPKIAPVPKRPTEQTADWQRKTKILVERAHERLFDDSDQEAEAGRHYLEHVRKLEPHTWLAFNLGYASSVAIPGTEGKERAPAIVIPWYRGKKVVAVRYRFLKKQDEHKQTALRDSKFSGVLFGGQALETGIAQLSTLLICEGEFNAASIWQVAKGTHLDVLSLGSESTAVTPAMIEHAHKYAMVLCWLDKQERARVVMDAFGLSPKNAIKSPDGNDANDLLCSQQLGPFLAMRRFVAARDQQEQERVYYDLVDATHLPGGVDEGTSTMIAHMAKTLGKQAPITEMIG